MKTIALALFMSIGSTAAQAQPLTLACQGTVAVSYGGYKEIKPTSVGLIIDLTAGTVRGLGDTEGALEISARITSVNDVTATFSGSASDAISTDAIRGSISRVTGDMEATYTISLTTTRELLSTQTYSLKCRPTQRMF